MKILRYLHKSFAINELLLPLHCYNSTGCRIIRLHPPILTHQAKV